MNGWTVGELRCPWGFLRGAFAGAAILLLAACSSTQITEDESVKWRDAKLPKPDQLVVFNFATSPDEVQLDHGLVAHIRELADKTPRTAQEKKIGHAVAEALSRELVAALREKGLPAVQAAHVVEPGVRPLQVKGQILSIDEGSRASRVIIGLGLGRSSVEARVQLYESLKGRAQMIDQITATTRSGRMPGMAEMMGVGALTGHLIVSTALSGATHFATERFSADVDALAKTMGKKLAAEIVQYYDKRGWR